MQLAPSAPATSQTLRWNCESDQCSCGGTPSSAVAQPSWQYIPITHLRVQFSVHLSITGTRSTLEFFDLLVYDSSICEVSIQTFHEWFLAYTLLFHSGLSFSCFLNCILLNAEMVEHQSFFTDFILCRDIYGNYTVYHAGSVVNLSTGCAFVFGDHIYIFWLYNPCSIYTQQLYVLLYISCQTRWQCLISSGSIIALYCLLAHACTPKHTHTHTYQTAHLQLKFCVRCCTTMTWSTIFCWLIGHIGFHDSEPPDAAIKEQITDRTQTWLGSSCGHPSIPLTFHVLFVWIVNGQTHRTSCQLLNEQYRCGSVPSGPYRGKKYFLYVPTVDSLIWWTRPYIINHYQCGTLYLDLYVTMLVVILNTWF